MTIEPFLNSNSILLVDGTNLLLRILYAKTSGGSIKTEDEIIEDCCVIFIHQLILYIKKYSSTRIFIAFDSGGSLRKESIFKEYKNNRIIKATSGVLAAFSDSTHSAFLKLKEKTIALCRAFNFPVISEYGIEADDIIGIAAEVLNTLNKPTIILSNDSDFLQLTKFTNVICSIPYKKEEVSYLNFNTYFNDFKKIKITPNEYLYYKSLIGDKTDNIDGIKGIAYKKLYTITNDFLTKNNSYIDIYLKNSEEFIETINSTEFIENYKLVSLIKENFNLIKRNLKLIDLSSTHMSSNALTLTYNFLKLKSEAPKRTELISKYKEIFNSSPNISFILDSMLSLKKLYE